MKPIEMTIMVRNNRMKTLRIASGMSQKKFAEIVGVGIGWISTLECLRRIKFSSNSIVRKEQEDRLYRIKTKIAQALDSDVSTVFPDELDLVTSNRVIKHIDVPAALQLQSNGERLKLGMEETNAFAKLDTEFCGEEIEKQLQTLHPREVAVLKLRYGLVGGYPRTYEEVSKILKKSRSRIMQIEIKAIRKLRHPSRSRPLRDYAYKQ